MKEVLKEKLILERFKIQKKLQEKQQLGKKQSFIIKNIYSNQKCLLKLQSSSELQGKSRNILHQASFFQTMQGHIGMPLMIWSGQDSEFLLLIIEQLGMTLADQAKLLVDIKMKTKDVCMIGIKLLDIIQNFHEKGFIHRNLTPYTLQFGKGEKCLSLYFNDLISTRKYLTKKNDGHFQQRKTTKIDKVHPFMSLNVLNQNEASRRDDIISIFYILIYLLKGKLPWSQKWQQFIMGNSKSINKMKSQESEIQQKIFILQYIKQQMSQITIKKLCQDLPNQFQQLLNLSYQLPFKQKPEYNHYKMMLKNLLRKSRLNYDDVFQWCQSVESQSKNLKVSKIIPIIKTRQDLEIQEIIYRPFEKNVQVDLLQNKTNSKQEQKKYFGKIKFGKHNSDHRFCQII